MFVKLLFIAPWSYFNLENLQGQHIFILYVLYKEQIMSMST